MSNNNINFNSDLVSAYFREIKEREVLFGNVYPHLGSVDLIISAGWQQYCCQHNDKVSENFVPFFYLFD